MRALLPVPSLRPDPRTPSARSPIVAHRERARDEESYGTPPVVDKLLTDRGPYSTANRGDGSIGERLVQQTSRGE